MDGGVQLAANVRRPPQPNGGGSGELRHRGGGGGGGDTPTRVHLASATGMQVRSNLMRQRPAAAETGVDPTTLVPPEAVYDDPPAVYAEEVPYNELPQPPLQPPVPVDQQHPYFVDTGQAIEPPPEDTFAAPPPPQRPQPPLARRSRASWLDALRYCLFGSAITFVALVVAATAFQLDLSALRRPHRGGADGVHPGLHTAWRRTESVPVADYVRDAQLLAALAGAFRHHLVDRGLSRQVPCLCRHHLALPGPHEVPGGGGVPMVRVCGVVLETGGASQQQLLVMANPAIVGRSNRTSQVRARTEDVIVEWVDPASRHTWRAHLSGTTAVCLQLATDEMAGDAHCA